MNRTVLSARPLLLAGALIPLGVFAQTFSGPSLGFLCDAGAYGLRPISGIAGAATQGKLIPESGRFSSCFVSPSNEFALFEREGQTSVSVAMLSGNATRRVLEGVDRGADFTVFSQSGKSVVLYYRSSASATVISGLPHSPVVSRLDLSTLPAPVSAIAIEDDGSSLLMGTADGETGSLFLVSRASHALQFLSSTVWPGAVAFLGTNDALVADSKTGRLTLIHNVATQAAQSVVAETGVAGINVLGISNDAKRAVLANQGTGDIRIVDFSGERMQSITCACQMGGLQRLTGNAVFLVGFSGQHLPIALDADGTVPRLAFIPDVSALNQGMAPGR